MRAAATASGFSWVELDRERLLNTTAEGLARGKVLGWYQGRSEWAKGAGNRFHPGESGDTGNERPHQPQGEAGESFGRRANGTGRACA